MTTRIIYSQQTQTGALVAQAVNAQMEALAKLRRVKAMLDSASYANDWNAIAAEVGGGVTDQQAQDLWTILATALAAVDVGAVAEMSRLDQG